VTTTIVLGDGGLGHAVVEGCRARGDEVRVLGRPVAGPHDPAVFAGATLAVEASRGPSVLPNVRAAVDGGVRRFVIATTAWDADRDEVQAILRRSGAMAVAAPNFSLGVALFSRLVDTAVGLFGRVDAFDPYLVEWHRRTKADRPSGTAAMLAGRIVDGHPRATAETLEVVSIRAGSAPGMHLVGFDAPGETVELRLTARDRSAYVAGILASADWLERAPRTPGLHPFDPVVDELLADAPVAPAAPVIAAA
jgi:4-hydroxy-tetrahydrodipicolinate reductase